MNATTETTVTGLLESIAPHTAEASEAIRRAGIVIGDLNRNRETLSPEVVHALENEAERQLGFARESQVKARTLAKAALVMVEG